MDQVEQPNKNLLLKKFFLFYSHIFSFLYNALTNNMAVR